MKVIGYARVSTAEQAEHGHSIDTQHAKLESYAALYGHTLLRVDVDAGESAGSLDRPGIKRALADLRKGRADGLLVVKLDRLTRSVRDLSHLLEGVFRKRALLGVEDHVDTSSAGGRLVLGLLTQVGQWEREAAGERTRAVKARQRTLGAYIGGSAPFGWRVALQCVKPSCGAMYDHQPGACLACGSDVYDRLVQVSDEQDAIARALELRGAGMSVRGVAELMSWSPGKAQRVIAYASKVE